MLFYCVKYKDKTETDDAGIVTINNKKR